ncbi:hypothetical protein H8K24_12345 [Blautia massiliensis]|nr:hypothetical protein [Blautia massiliensis (ex Durand et al. 2017)]MBC3534762.1 hypothetical protein [Blautia massiliensis (ex Durand et al. 2017)]
MLFDKAERICYGISGNLPEFCICDRSFMGSGEQIQNQSECYKEKEMPEK